MTRMNGSVSESLLIFSKFYLVFSRIISVTWWERGNGESVWRKSEGKVEPCQGTLDRNNEILSRSNLFLAPE